MKAIYSETHSAHDPQFFLVRGRVGRSAEQPERAAVLKAAGERAGLDFSLAGEHDRQCYLAAHSPQYLSFLEEASRDWATLTDASPEVTANVHPNRYAATYPRSIIGRAGWHMADTACPIGPATFTAATASADVALSAADLIIAGENSAYGLCRPPGHHAYRDMAGGFCFLNNAAIAAQYLRSAFERIAILDIDVHHGNGTQAIFYDCANILTVSVHADPRDYYPFFWGHAHERGSRDGEGCNLNLPLPLATSDELWLDTIQRGLDTIVRFAPDCLIIALGLDAHEHDPLRGMEVTTQGFERAGSIVGKSPWPVLIVQEGGYLSDHLGTNLEAFLKSLV